MMYGRRRRRLAIFGALGAVVVVAAIVAIVAASGSNDTKAASGPSASRILTIAVSGDPETLDSDQSHFQLSNEVNFNTQDPFFRYGTKPGPGYAQYDVSKILAGSIGSWKFSADRKRVELHVRPGMHFAKTGNPVTADDYIYWFKRAFGTKAGYLFQTSNAGITGYKKTGPMSLQLTFKHPSASFLPLFRDQATAPVDSVEMRKHATTGDPWSKSWKARHDAGSGPYMIESTTPGVQTVLVANPRYTSGPKPYFQKVILKVVPSAANRALLLRRGSVDIAESLGNDDLNALRSASGVTVLSIPDRNQYHLGFNATKPPFNKPAVRQALSYAVPYDSIVKNTLGGQAAASQSPIARAGAFFNGSFWPYKLDLAKAKSLLAQAGYPSGFKFDLKISTDDPALEEMAIILKSSFKKVGVDMTIDKQTPAIFAEGLNTGKDQSFLRSLLWYIDDPGYVGQAFYQCGSLLNWMHYCNKQVDALIKQIAALPPDATARKTALANQMQRLLVDDAPTLELGEPNYQLAMRSDLKGYVHLADDLLNYATLRRG
jgi:peptide/nickel transport system substrate-binding protein